MMDKPKIVAVVGPTASGKTALSVMLASAFDGEIISCDSMQIYRTMNIGTAKPDEAERAGIRHHMMDAVSPDELFSCADYAKMATECLRDILERGRLPIFCGGTGLYLDAVLKGGHFAPDVDPAIRAELSSLSPEELYRMLSEADPEAAAAIHPNNVKRVIRALEIFRGTGKTKTEWDRLSRFAGEAYDVLKIGLDYRDRTVLYDRIDRRIGMMLDAGLADEVIRLDLRRESTAAQAIGYKELYAWLDGKISFDDAVAMLKQNTRNYAKRQLTWFRRDPKVFWIYPDDYAPEEREEAVKNIATRALCGFIKNNG